jgi:hypothetical protein
MDEIRIGNAGETDVVGQFEKGCAAFADPFDFARGRLSLRKGGLPGMTMA